VWQNGFGGFAVSRYFSSDSCDPFEGVSVFSGCGHFNLSSSWGQNGFTTTARRHDQARQFISRKGAEAQREAKKGECASLPILTAFFFAPWRLCVRRLSDWLCMCAEPERGARLRAILFVRFRKREMKGPQGLGDSGAEASNEAREV
jgi:hypothetical protein